MPLSRFTIAAAWILVAELAFGICATPIPEPKNPTKKQRKAFAVRQRENARDWSLAANARMLRIDLAVNKAQYLPNEKPTFTVTITNPLDRALEVPLPFHPRTSGLFEVGHTREDCGTPPEIPATMVLLPLESVTTQVSGQPRRYHNGATVQYHYGYIDYGPTTEVRFLDVTISAVFEVPLSNTYFWANEFGTKSEYPRTATVFTAEAGGRHFLALYEYAHKSNLKPSKQLAYDHDFQNLRLVDESDQPIRILSVTESPVNVLNITYTVATGIEKKLQFSLDDSTNRLLKQ